MGRKNVKLLERAFSYFAKILRMEKLYDNLLEMLLQLFSASRKESLAEDVMLFIRIEPLFYTYLGMHVQT
jgi:hypothetical protein